MSKERLVERTGSGRHDELGSGGPGRGHEAASVAERAGVPLNQIEARNRLLLRARDTMDRRFSEELDVAALARSIGLSEAHFIRTFKEVFAETPHRYLQRRRVERAMFLLRDSNHDSRRSVTDICFDVGFNSLGTFSRTFKDIVGISPSSYRDGTEQVAVPSCFISSWARPSSFGEARPSPANYSDSAAEEE